MIHCIDNFQFLSTYLILYNIYIYIYIYIYISERIKEDALILCYSEFQA